MIRNNYVFVLVLLLLFQYSNAQKVNFGLLGGSTYGGFIGKLDSTTSGKPLAGLMLGGYATLSGKKIALQIESFYNIKSVQFEKRTWNADTLIQLTKTDSNKIAIPYDSKVKGFIKIEYVQVPILLKYNLKKWCYLLAGPQVGFSLRRDYEYQVDVNAGLYRDIRLPTMQQSEGYKLSKIDYGFIVGGGVHFAKRFDAMLRLDKGLVNVLKDKQANTQLTAFFAQAMLGIRLF